MAALLQAPGATVTLDGGSVTTASQLGSGAWAIGSATLSAGELYTLDNSQVFSAGSSDLNLDGTAVHATEPVTTGYALLTGSDTTVTAYKVPGTTGVGVVDGQTISYRGSAITLDTGEVVSMAWDGVEDRTQTVEFSSTTGLRAPAYGETSQTTRSVDFSSTTGQVYPVPGSSKDTDTVTNTDTDTSTTSVSPATSSTTTDTDSTETSASSTTSEDAGAQSSTGSAEDSSETTPSGSSRIHLAWSSCCLAALFFVALTL